ncbi:MAG: o-succinylbenzoate synthase [Spirulina sp. SIO3F2]|nr:o-succinylbenzoate synthase [Spirulina sp. SIO3F2]
MWLTLTPYSYSFKTPLETAHGRWSQREGIVITLLDATTGQRGRGEIAPLPWFGTETLDAALSYCTTWGTQLDLAVLPAVLAEIPDTFPACQFGLATAWLDLTQPTPPIALDIAQVAHLLPLTSEALTRLQDLQAQGATTFKCKIGVQDPEQEMAIWQTLSQQDQPQTQFRLDANGGLTPAIARQWLELAQVQGNVEFIEQPLAPAEFATMQALAQESDVMIALDESVTTFADLQRCYQQGWRGVYVLKPAIAGFPDRLIEFCQQHPIDLVCSSVFETAIGRQGALRVAQQLGSQRALGFGVNL